MSDQKEMKRRLKVLMQKPENQVCSDCPERQPRWASLIVPPPGSPPGSTKIGAFCCLECSGSHRRLGVHISFVRSVNLDSWKEAEVLAMENGGNKKVNAIWEANLQRAGGQKPATGADLNTRERYIRDKYERRRFFDPQALVDYQNNEPSFDDIGSKNHGEDFANFGPPADSQVSDAAKLRAEKKKKTAKSFTDAADSDATRRRPKKRDSQLQPEVDLLDLGTGGGGNQDPSTNASAPAPFADLFCLEATTTNPPVQPTMEPPRRKSSHDGPSRSRSSNRDPNQRTKSKTPDRETTRKNQQLDILNMYNNNNMGTINATNPMAALNNNPANMMIMMQQMQQMNINQQSPMGSPMSDATTTGPKHNARLAMHQNLMMQQMQTQSQQQQQNLQQMQRMMQQLMQQPGINPQMIHQPFGTINPQIMMQQPFSASGAVMNPQMMQQFGAAMNPQMMQAMMMQQQNYNKMQMINPGMNVNHQNTMMMMGATNPNMMTISNNNNTFGGMSMMANGNGNTNNTNQPPADKEDPFSQFGMNAFR